MRSNKTEIEFSFIGPQASVSQACDGVSVAFQMLLQCCVISTVIES